MRIVLDTNVLVSGLLKPRGKPAKVLEVILSGAVTPLLDERVLDEYRGVLARPKFKLPEKAKAEVLGYLARESERVTAKASLLNSPTPTIFRFSRSRCPATPTRS